MAWKLNAKRHTTGTRATSPGVTRQTAARTKGHAVRSFSAEPLEGRCMLSVSIASGQTINASLHGQLDSYTIAAKAGGSIVVSMGSSDRRGYSNAPMSRVQVLSPTGQSLGTSTGDAYGGSTTLTLTSLPSSGTYTIIASSADGDGGNYNIAVGSLPATPIVDSDGGTLTSGQEVAGNLNGDLDVYSITNVAGGTVTASMGSSDRVGYSNSPQCKLQLFGPAGQLLGTSVGDAYGRSTLLTVTDLPSTGSYYVVASSADGDGGNYNIAVASLPGPVRTDADGGPLASGSSVTGNVTGSLDVYTLSASAHTEVITSVGSSDRVGYSDAPQCQVRLFDPAGKLLATATGDPYGRNTTLDYKSLPESGTYYLVINSADGDAGNYSLSAVYSTFVSSPTIKLTAPGSQSVTAGTPKSVGLGSFSATATTGPYTVTVAWGDGTANTTFTTSTLGTIAAQTHTFAKAATDTVAVTVKDAKGVTSNKATFAVTVAAVATPKLTATPPAGQSAMAGVSKSVALGSFSATATTGPYTVTVAWGDGTANTTFTTTQLGTIAAQNHTFAKAATDTVAVTVKDAKGVTSNKATFAVTVSAAVSRATITGTVFKDADGNGAKGSAEGGLGGVTVYLDANKNGSLDSTEKKTTTDSSGQYTFAGLSAGTYRVRQVTPSGYKATAPSAGYADVVAAAGKTVAGPTFADAPSTGSIAGTVFNDANGDGKFSSTELGLGLWQVYLDLNKNGKYDAGTDTLATTDINGSYTFANLTAGSYAVRVVQVAKTATTTPGGGVQTVVVSAGAVSGKVFGEKRIG